VTVGHILSAADPRPEQRRGGLYLAGAGINSRLPYTEPDRQADTRKMNDTSGCRCRQVGPRFDALRVWAWDRGRTDIIWDLDLHAAAWAAWDAPTCDNLARLAALLPIRELDDRLRANVERFTTPGDVTRSEHPAWLKRWCQDLCVAVETDLAEMATGRRPDPGGS
jgi:hypothetical protein